MCLTSWVPPISLAFLSLPLFQPLCTLSTSWTWSICCSSEKRLWRSLRDQRLTMMKERQLEIWKHLKLQSPPSMNLIIRFNSQPAVRFRSMENSSLFTIPLLTFWGRSQLFSWSWLLTSLLKSFRSSCFAWCNLVLISGRSQELTGWMKWNTAWKSSWSFSTQLSPTALSPSTSTWKTSL